MKVNLELSQREIAKILTLRALLICDKVNEYSYKYLERNGTEILTLANISINKDYLLVDVEIINGSELSVPVTDRYVYHDFEFKLTRSYQESIA